MNPIALIIPIVMALSGVVIFMMAPLDLGLRVGILIGDLLGAAIVGFFLMRARR